MSTTTTIIVALCAGYGGAALFRWWHRRHDADVTDRTRKLERVAWAARRLLSSSIADELEPRYAALADAIDELDGVDVEDVYATDPELDPRR